jgi:hypothetical protein
MKARYSDILIQMKSLDFAPIDPGLSREDFEKFDLGVTRGKNQSAATMFGDGLVNRCRSLLAGGASERRRIWKNSRVHVSSARVSRGARI